MRLLKELAHNYDSLVGDSTRVMNRLKALFRSRAISCSGRDVYYSRHRDQWLGKLTEPGGTPAGGIPLSGVGPAKGATARG